MVEEKKQNPIKKLKKISKIISKRKIKKSIIGLSMKIKKVEAGTKVLASSIVSGLSSKTQWLSGLYYADFISFTALLNCAEVGRPVFYQLFESWKSRDVLTIRGMCPSRSYNLCRRCRYHQPRWPICLQGNLHHVCHRPTI